MQTAEISFSLMVSELTPEDRVRTSDTQKVETWSGISASSGGADTGMPSGCHSVEVFRPDPTEGDLRADHEHAGGIA